MTFKYKLFGECRVKLILSFLLPRKITDPRLLNSVALDCAIIVCIGHITDVVCCLLYIYDVIRCQLKMLEIGCFTYAKIGF